MSKPLPPLTLHLGVSMYGQAPLALAAKLQEAVLVGV